MDSFIIDATDTTNTLEDWDTDSLSDRSSVTSIISSCISESSIDHEFSEAIEELERLCVTQHQAIEGLHRLQHVVDQSYNRILIHDTEINEYVDFEEIITRLHTTALNEIENGQSPQFINQLLEWIERIPSDE